MTYAKVETKEGQLLEIVSFPIDSDLHAYIESEYKDKSVLTTPITEQQANDLKQPILDAINVQNQAVRKSWGAKVEPLVCAELSEYDKDLMQLHEQCRKCELTSYGLFIAIDTLANKHVIHAKRVIADLFAC